MYLLPEMSQLDIQVFLRGVHLHFCILNVLFLPSLVVSSQLLALQTLLGSALPLGVPITISTFSTFKVRWEDATGPGLYY